MTTVAPTTSAPTTLSPTTATPTTVAPTTAAPDQVIVIEPVSVANAIDNVGRPDPIEMSITIHGSMLNVGISDKQIEMSITVHGAIVIGQVMEGDPIEVSVTVANDGTVWPSVIEIESQYRCNWIKWSKIGEMDFTIDHTNMAGERPMDWKGCIYHIAKLGRRVIVYGDNGVTVMSPNDVHWGMNTIYTIGLKNKGAFAASDDMHYFVDKIGNLWSFNGEQRTKLDYVEFISQMGTVILSYDMEQDLLYITDGTTGYVYSVDSQSFGEAVPNVTGVSAQQGNLYVVSSSEIETPKFQIETDIYDMGVRKPKTIERLEFGTDLAEFLRVSIKWRVSYKDEFRQIPWFIVNHDGRAYPKCYGVEFKFLITSTVYEYFELDYMRVRGRIHGYSYLDTAGQ